jgi:hypothetical protein
MQVTRAAFQAVVSLNVQATDPKSHTLVSNFYTRISLVPPPAIPMVDSRMLLRATRGDRSVKKLSAEGPAPYMITAYGAAASNGGEGELVELGKSDTTAPLRGFPPNSTSDCLKHFAGTANVWYSFSPEVNQAEGYHGS